MIYYLYFNFIQICFITKSMKYLETLAGSTKPDEKDWGYLPYILILMTAFTWGGGWIYFNQHKINFAQSAIIRGITLIPLNYIVCRWFNNPTDVKETVILKVHITRNFIMFIHSVLFASSQFILPLPVAHTINCSGALFIFLIDYLMNKVKINYKQGIGILIGFVGAIIVTNSGLLTKMIDPQYKYKSHFQNYITDDPLIMTLFSIVFLIGIFVWSYGVVITKQAHSNTFQINYILGINLVFYGAIFYPFIETKATKAQLFISLFASGLPLVLNQWLYVAAITMTKNTGVLNMAGFSSIIVGYLVSIFRYGESPNIISLIGVIFVVIGIYKAVINKDKIIS